MSHSFNYGVNRHFKSFKMVDGAPYHQYYCIGGCGRLVWQHAHTSFAPRCGSVECKPVKHKPSHTKRLLHKLDEVENLLTKDEVKNHLDLDEINSIRTRTLAMRKRILGEENDKTNSRTV